MKDTHQVKQENSSYNLILKCKKFIIPSQFSSLKDINPNIYKELKEKGTYHIKSRVKEDTFQSFINNWIYNEIPLINYSNFPEYEQLSQEFDRMKDIIQLFLKNTSNTDSYSLICKKEKFFKKVQEKSDEFHEKTDTYQKMISLLFNNAQSNKYFRTMDNKEKIFSSCLADDVSYAELLSQKTVENDGLLYSLNEEEKTAVLYGQTNNNNKVIFVPKAVFYDSQEFIVKKIFKRSFFLSQSIQTVQFPNDSELQEIDDSAFSNSTLETIVFPSSVTHVGQFVFSFCNHLQSVEFSKNSNLESIGKCSFYNSSIQYLSIPSSIIEFEDSLFNMAFNLINVNVFSNNQIENIVLYNNEFILKKSDLKSDIFDILAFAKRNIEVVKIPSFIKVIGSFAFQNCANLKNVEFSDDSELEIIDQGSFHSTTIENILIPKHVTKISSFAFCGCKRIQSVKFAENSELKVIEKNAFSSSSILSILIPSNVISIEKKVFFNCKNINSIIFSEKSNLKLIGNEVFALSTIETISIPSSIDELKINWCRDILNLNNIKIFKNEEKQNISFYNNDFILGKTNQKSDTFDILLFARRNIENAVIPSFITKISPNSFQNCSKLKSVKFSENSELKSIGNYSFSNSSIESIIIPKNVEFIGESAFYNTKLESIEFSKESKIKILNEGVFENSQINSILIPSSVTQIKERSLSNCNQLKSISFASNSKLNSIEKNSFLNSPIESLTIPSSVTNLKKGWCNGLFKLDKIEIVKCKIQNFINLNNELIIGKSEPTKDVFDVIVLATKNIKKITIPSFIKRIGRHSFQNCSQLKTVIFNSDSKLYSIEKFAFDNSSIEEIKIPSNVTQIQKCAFSSCKINHIDFSQNNKLKRIEKFAFAMSFIEEFSLPQHILSIGEGAFNTCTFLKKFYISEKSDLKSIDKYAFTDCPFNSLFIPPNVCELTILSFIECPQLQIIEIASNSKLKKIDAIENETINTIFMIPSDLKNSFK